MFLPDPIVLLVALPIAALVIFGFIMAPIMAVVRRVWPDKKPYYDPERLAELERERGMRP